MNSESRHPDRQRSDAQDPTLPPVIGPYKILRSIGRGGMGRVYLAVDPDDKTRTRYAIKLLETAANAREVLGRLQRKGLENLTQLDHPNIARLIRVGRTLEGHAYFVSEFVDGLPVDRYCDQHRLSIDQRLGLFRKICAAVNVAHQNLIVHQNLKPNNLLITEAGEPKVVDLGFSQLVEAGRSSTITSDTPTPRGVLLPGPYISPEHLQEKAITTATDVYSLGIVLYQLLCGRSPYRLKTRSLVDLLDAIGEQIPEMPSLAVMRRPDPGTGNKRVPPTPAQIAQYRQTDPQSLVDRLTGDLDALTLRALAKEPRDRFSSVAELSEEVRLLLEPAVAAESSFRLRDYLRRHFLRVASLATLIVLSGFLGFGICTAQARARQSSQVTSELVLELLETADTDTRALLEKVHQNGDTPALAQILNDRASALERLGQYAAAETLYREALAMKQRLYGDEPHSSIALALNNLAANLEAQGSYDEAEALYHRSLDMRQAVEGPRSKGSAKATNNLGILLQNKGDYTAAEQLLHESLTIRSEAYAADHPSIGTALNNLAYLELLLGKHEAAAARYERALAIFRQAFGSDHPNVATVLRNQAALHFVRGEWQAAMTKASQAIKIFGATYTHWRTADAENLLGGCLTELGRYHEAAFLLERSYPVLLRARGDNAPQTREAMARRTRFCEATENPQAANDTVPSAQTERRAVGC